MWRCTIGLRGRSDSSGMWRHRRRDLSFAIDCAADGSDRTHFRLTARFSRWYDRVSMPGPGSSSRAAESSASEQRWRSHMRGIRARDAESLAALYDESSRFLYGLALHILRDPADAEEVIMDVYQHIWSHAGLYDEARGNVWSWLATVTRHRAIDRLRHASGRRAREVPIEFGF